MRLVHRRRLYPKRIRETHEEVEQRGVVGRLGDLLVAPPGVPQSLDLRVGDSIGMPRDRRDELEEQAVRRVEIRPVQVATPQRLSDLPVRLALQLQEPRV